MAQAPRLSRLAPGERAFVFLFLPVALGFGGRMALVAFDGPLAHRFTASGYRIGLLLAIGPLVSAVANPWVGRISDRTWTRWGRRIPFALVGLPLSSLLLFAIPWAESYGELLGLFLLRALFASLAGVTLMSLIPDQVAAARRGRAMAIFMVAGGLGAIAVQATGKLVWERHFGLVYVLAGALALVFAFPPLLWIRERPPEPRDRAQALGTRRVTLAGALSALARGEPVARFLEAASLRYLGNGIVITYLTLFASVDAGVGVGDAALAVAAGSAARLLGALPSGWLADARDRKRLLLAVTLGGAAIQVATAGAVRGLGGLYAVALASGLVGSLEMACAGPYFMDLLPAHRRGELIGLNMVLGNGLRGVGALLGGAAFAWSGSYRATYALAALCFLVSAWILRRVPSPADFHAASPT